MLRRILRWASTPVILLVLGCTPAQTRAWLAWHHDDPEGAVAYLDTPEGEAALAETDTDGPQFEEWLTALPTPGNCASYAPLFERYGLPVAAFTRIAWRESGCDHRSYVVDRDDAGGGLLGINLRGSLGAVWHGWCGVTLASVTNAEKNIACAATAYDRMGMAPWT